MHEHEWDLKNGMMQECKSCPGKEGVVNLLSSLEKLDLSEDITYRQWMTTDR